MPFLTTPLTTAFEFQRITIEQSQELLETGIDFQSGVNDALVGGIGDQEDVQRRFLTLQHVAIHRFCDRAEERLPGVEPAVTEVRDVVDDQFSQLYDNHEEVFDTVVDELENSADTYDDVSEGYLDALDEQIEVLVGAHENLETQSVDAVEQFQERLDVLQEQLNDLRDEIEPLQEDTAE